MTYFTRIGNVYRITDEDSIQVTKSLPVGNYIVKITTQGEYFLEKVDDFSFSGKRYGNVSRNVERILNTFYERSASTGILLTGEKGSGKSLLAKLLSIEAASKGIPTLIVNSPFFGDVFNKFIQDIDHECVILFDEFEKTYDSEEQKGLLTLLDGMFPTKKMFVLTCNDKYRIDSHMRNRPGRIFYMIEFGGLGIDFVREYCHDKMVNKSAIESVCRCSSLLPKFTFDQLQALVEELNRYGETPEEAMAMLNVKPEFNDEEALHITILRPNGVAVPVKDLDREVHHGNPLTLRSSSFGYWDEEDKDKDGDANHTRFHISTSDIVSLDPQEGSFVFKSECGHTLILKRPKYERPAYLSLVA